MLFCKAWCQESDEVDIQKTAVTEEPEREVAAMDQFLGVLRPVLQARMEGDWKTVRDSMPTLLKMGQNLVEADLPPFHNDVEAEFKEYAKTLADAIDQFKSVAGSDNDSLLEESIEGIRAAFVEIMILLSPQVEEIDDFHEVLRPLWHDATPNQDYDAIKEAIPELKARADAIVKAQLAKKYSFLEKEFKEKGAALKTAVDNLARVCHENKDDKIEDMMYEMHEAYHALTECLE